MEMVLKRFFEKRVKGEMCNEGLLGTINKLLKTIGGNFCYQKLVAKEILRPYLL